MSRYTIYLSEDLEKKLNEYMKQNKIKKRSVAIKECLCKIIQKEDYDSSIYEVNDKLNRILYRESLSRKLLEQFFANMGFQINEPTDKDELLKAFYEKNNNFRRYE